MIIKMTPDTLTLAATSRCEVYVGEEGDAGHVVDPSDNGGDVVVELNDGETVYTSIDDLTLNGGTVDRIRRNRRRRGCDEVTGNPV